MAPALVVLFLTASFASNLLCVLCLLRRRKKTSH
jgi:hypothetical protein